MIIDGRALAREVLERTKARAEALGKRPLVVAYVAQEPTPATRSYLNIKKKSAEASGCIFEERTEPTFTDADAAIVQLPIPKEAMTLLETIPVRKDADVLSSSARKMFEQGNTDALLPPVVGAVKEIFDIHGLTVLGKKAVVVGSGFLVGAPVATWLAQQGADVTVLTAQSAEVSSTLQSADIIVSGVGSPHMIKPDMLSDGVVLIDAGTSESGGVLAGDADPACATKCSLFTPVPGGIGPIAVAKLFENAVALAEMEDSRATDI